MNRDIVRQLAVIVTFVTTIVMNGLATGLPLNGMDTGTISDMFVNYFTPASYVFSIWGVIYLGLTGYTVYQALPAQRASALQRRIGWVFVISNFFNSAWIVAWHYLQFNLSWFLMIGILIALLTIYLRIEREDRPLPSVTRWLVAVPFSIYTAWISVATIANSTILLQNLGFEGGPLPAPIWSAAMLVIGGSIAAYIAFTRRDVAYAAVFVWAFAGIVVKYSDILVVAAAAILMAIVIVLFLIAGAVRNQPRSGKLQGNPVSVV